MGGAQQAGQLILLTPNIFMKDLRSLEGDCQTPSIALNCMSQICNKDLAPLVYRELLPLFTCSKPVLRKKACTMSYKIFIHAGENEHMIEELTPYLSDRLKDSDASVRMAAIQVIYEITRINPSLFVFTIPQVFQLLCESTNNWVLIKLIKLLTEFCNAEPRLLGKLMPKFKNLLESQKAKSVQYEVVKSILHLYRDKPDQQKTQQASASYDLYDMAVKILI